MSDLKFSEQVPNEGGLWEIKCMENDQKPNRVAITKAGLRYYVHCPYLGCMPVQQYHDGLCEVTWRKIA